MTERDRRRIASIYPPAINTVADYQTWEVLRHLAAHDPAFLRELEAAA